MMPFETDGEDFMQATDRRVDFAWGVGGGAGRMGKKVDESLSSEGGLRL